MTAKEPSTIMDNTCTTESLHQHKMAALLWTVVSLLLIHEGQAQVVSETELARIVTQLYNAYRPNNWIRRVNGQNIPYIPTFTLAVSVPFNTATRSFDVGQVTAADPSQNVRTDLDNCQVYQGQRVMAATVLKWPAVKYKCPNAVIPNHWTFVRQLCPNVNTWAQLNRVCDERINNDLITSGNSAVDHAEYRVLQGFNYLYNRLTTGLLNQNDLLVYFSLKSPCYERCGSRTHNWSILGTTANINQINSWPRHVLAFSEIYEPSYNTLNENQLRARRRTSLNNLGNAIQGLGNIYRCPVGGNRCNRCSSTRGVADVCI